MSDLLIAANSPVQPIAPSADTARRAYFKSFEAYRKVYAESLADPNAFWGRLALETLDWFHPFSKASDCDFE